MLYELDFSTFKEFKLIMEFWVLDRIFKLLQWFLFHLLEFCKIFAKDWNYEYLSKVLILYQIRSKQRLNVNLTLSHK